MSKAVYLSMSGLLHIHMETSEEVLPPEVLIVRWHRDPRATENVRLHHVGTLEDVMIRIIESLYAYGRNQTWLARRLGVSQQQPSTYKHGQRVPRMNAQRWQVIGQLYRGIGYEAS